MLSELQEDRMVWIRALESGEYSKTKGVLKGGNGHCCIGVAREVHPDLANNATYYVIAEKYGYEDDYNDTGGALETILIGMNDEEDRSFKEIAQFLRNYWELTDAT